MSMIRRIATAFKGADGAPGDRLSREEGAALITALMFLLILTALGLASIMTSSTEVLISRNDRLDKLALDYANAGVQAAMAQMDAKQLGSSAKTTSAVGSQKWHFDSGSAQLGIAFMNFSGTIQYRTEDDLHYHGKNTINPATGDNYDRPDFGSSNEVVGYCQDCGYASSPVGPYNRSLPVLIITSHGWVGDSSDPQALATVSVEVAKNTINVTSNGGLESPDCAALVGNINVFGEGTNPGYISADPSCSPGGGSVVINPPAQVGATLENISTGNFFGVMPSDVRDYATQTFTYTSNDTITNIDTVAGMPFGNYSSNPEIIYVDNPGHLLTLNNGVGYGILVVTGNLKMTGNISWHGLIYVFGNVQLGGGGAEPVNIDGTVKAGGTTTFLNGNVTVSQDQYILDKIATDGVKTRILNWRRQYN